jgi:hypothetical protein
MRSALPETRRFAGSTLPANARWTFRRNDTATNPFHGLTPLPQHGGRTRNGQHARRSLEETASRGATGTGPSAKPGPKGWPSHAEVSASPNTPRVMDNPADGSPLVAYRPERL